MQMPMDRTMPSGEGVTPAQGVGSSSDLLSPTWLFDRLGPHRDWIGDALSRILGDQSLSRLISLWPTLSQAKGSAVVVLQRIFLSFLLVRAPLREEFVKKAREFVAIVVKDLPWDQIASDENNFESSHVNVRLSTLSPLSTFRLTSSSILCSYLLSVCPCCFKCDLLFCPQWNLLDPLILHGPCNKGRLTHFPNRLL